MPNAPRAVNTNWQLYNPHMAKPGDVAIVGGGIIGLTCAYFLAREGLSVEVFDRGELGQEASWAGAGIIPPGNPTGAATPIDRLRAIGSVRFPEFSNELRDLTGIDNGYICSGGIEFLDDKEARDVLELWRNEGITFERLTHDGLQIAEPSLAYAPARPYLLPQCAQVRNPRHLRALIAGCERVGVKLHPNTRVEDLTGERSIARLAASGKRVLIAAGPWSNDLISPLNRCDPGIHPVRGQIVLLKSAERVISRVLMFGKRYLVPRTDGHVLVGSTEEPEARFEKGNTAEAVADLLAFATRMVPRLASAELVKCWSGLRPATRDGLPLIGPIPGRENVFVATGHFRAGVQLSIGTAQAIAELFTGKPTCVPLETFALDRKPSTGGKVAFRS